MPLRRYVCAAPRQRLREVAAGTWNRGTSLSVSGLGRGSLRAVGISRAAFVIPIEHKGHDLLPFQDIQRFPEELASGPVGRDHEKKSVHQFPDDPTIRDRHEG